MANAQPPADEQEGPYGPLNPAPLMLDNFMGINTSAPRSGIPDDALFVCDGFMPVEPGNLRVLPDIGPAIYLGPGPDAVIFYDFGNIGSLSYCIIFLADGSIIAAPVFGPGPDRVIAPAGTITSPSNLTLGVSQWGNQYILIVSKQTNGYYIWDGTAFYTSGTVSPLVTVTNSGLNYTSAPNVVASGGSGSGATFTATINAGSVQNIFVDNPGSGYKNGDLVVLTISGGGSDSTASATANVTSSGGIASVNVSNPGSIYPNGSYVVGTGGGGSGANFVGELSNGQMVSVAVNNPGTGYTSPPTLAITQPAGGTGSGFVGQAVLANGQITSVTLVSGGSGYTTPPTVTVSGDGSGAVIQALISGGAVTGFTIVNPGLGYTKAALSFSGGNNAASATIGIMPYGVSGTTVETFQSRVWIGNGDLLNFTAPESVTDFATSDGGGAAESTDSFLRIAYSRLQQTNGFLYLLGDSSINYISGVQTAGTPPTTTYTNQNADPEIGTPWPATVTVFSRNIIFANLFGVHVSYGGAVTKVSEALDGLFNTIPRPDPFIPSAAKAIIFGKKVWMLLLPVIDPISGARVNKLFMWNGKNWWSSQQSVTLTFIAAFEVDSNLTAYGTDGQNIYPLFDTPSTNFTKTVQSKLSDKPGGYMFTKSTSRLWGMTYYSSLLSPALNITIDNENGSSPVSIAGPTALGNYIFPPTAVGQAGVLSGITLTTNAADMSVVSMAISNQIQAYLG